MTTLSHIERQFPAGTPVRVQQWVERREGAIEVQVVGVVEAWEELPTGSWYAHGKYDRLWLQRLKLRKADGEQSLLVCDERTAIARIEPTASS